MIWHQCFISVGLLAFWLCPKQSDWVTLIKGLDLQTMTRKIYSAEHIKVMAYNNQLTIAQRSKGWDISILYRF